MMHLGTKASQSREMILDDIFLLRLKLLLHMAKDFLDGREFSDLRRQIVADNARHVQIETMELGRMDSTDGCEPIGQYSVFIDHYFYRCVYELAMLMALMAKGESLDRQREKALLERFEAVRQIQNSMHFGDLFPAFAN